MLLYRACNKIEAEYQTIGKPRVAPPDNLLSKNWVKMHGLFMTFFPEVWRRYQNQGKEFLGFYWDHTLLLEVASCIEMEEGHGMAGTEYYIDDPESAIVRGIAGPDWPLPDWVPQPSNEKEWNPTSTDWQDKNIYFWTPRGVDPSALWWHPFQRSQQKSLNSHLGRQMMQNILWGNTTERQRSIFGVVLQ